MFSLISCDVLRFFISMKLKYFLNFFLSNYLFEKWDWQMPKHFICPVYEWAHLKQFWQVINDNGRNVFRTFYVQLFSKFYDVIFKKILFKSEEEK